MSYIQITNREYINTRHVASIIINDISYTHITDEYTDKAKFWKIERYEIVTKMSNGSVYKEIFGDLGQAEERRDNICLHW